LLFFLSCNISYGQTPQDSIKQVIENFSTEQKRGKISDSIYIRKVFNITRYALSDNIHFSNKELLSILAHYRSVIWDNKKNAADKRLYYAIFSNQGQMTGRSGEMLYYGEKIEKVEKELSGKPSLTSLAIIIGYYEEQGAFEKIRDIFHKNRDYLLGLAKTADSGTLSKENMNSGEGFIFLRLIGQLMRIFTMKF